jgi:putative peptidoglycan lipid II flippase
LTDAIGADERRTAAPAGRGQRAALLVAFGIFCSRVAGLVRQRVFAHYFGLTAPADAFTAASRIPNVLNNLFGEGALSGSFIPVYATLLARGEREIADRVAGAIAALLAFVVAAGVLIGVLVTPWILPLIAPGFTGPTRELAIRLVRILFPAVGLTVMSAWCLGVLNSHRRFFLSTGRRDLNGADRDARAVREGKELPDSGRAVRRAPSSAAG